MASKVGGRHVCEDCGSEFILLRAGSTDFAVTCCGKPLASKLTAAARAAGQETPPPGTGS